MRRCCMADTDKPALHPSQSVCVSRVMACHACLSTYRVQRKRWGRAGLPPMPCTPCRAPHLSSLPSRPISSAPTGNLERASSAKVPAWRRRANPTLAYPALTKSYLNGLWSLVGQHWFRHQLLQLGGLRRSDPQARHVPYGSATERGSYVTYACARSPRFSHVCGTRPARLLDPPRQSDIP